jgi:phosphoglycolate phosphatase
MRLFLFDIDGTLVHTGGVGKRALERALAEHFGVAGALAEISLSGRTDPGILRLACAALSRPFDEAALTGVLSRYVGYLEAEIARAADRGRWLLGGARALCESLSKKARLGLATGNVEAGARLKLGAVELNHLFPVGGFGSDAEDRAALCRAGAEKARRHYGEDFDAVVVVGDTPLDIQAAAANGFLAVGVCTGTYREEALVGAGASAVLRSLDEPGAEELLLTVL